MRALIVVTLLVGLATIWDARAEDSKYKQQQVAADQLYTQGDYQKAMKEYLPLAKKGDSFSQYRISYMYLEGQGVKPDLVEAYAWSALAAQNDQTELTTYRNTVATLVPEEDRRKAQRQRDYYIRKWGNVALVNSASKAATKEMRNCTGSRLGTRCEDVESAEMPAFWGINPGNGSGSDGGGAAPSGSVSSNQGKPSTGSPRDVKYYQDLRASIKEINSYIEQNSGRVTIEDIGDAESAPTQEPAVKD